MTIRKSEPKRGGRGWLLAIVMGVMSLAVMGLINVWCNIERMDTNYYINVAKDELNKRRDLHDKLQLERERLLSPYELKRKAQEYGMREASVSQIRRLEMK